MNLAGLSLAFVLIGTPLAPDSADLPQIVAVEQASTAAPQPQVPAPAPTTLPPCPQGAALPSAPPAPGEQTPVPAEQGAIVVTARPDSEPGDPMVQLNAQSYEVVQEVDEALVGPVAMTYKEAIPKPIRHGLRNFLRNLTEPIVALNFMLQLKPGKAAETVGRFALNTTLGIGGLFDVAKRDPFKLPYRRNGFANTLGYYGVKPGAYLFLPLIGPTTVRDLVGGAIDGMLLPSVAGAPFNDPYFTLPAATLSALQGRIQIDEQLNALRTYSNDPYVDARDFYLKRRQAEIDALRGRTQYPDGELPFVNPGTGGPVPMTPIVPVTPGVNCVPVGGY
ncbi:MAG: VacJ family lipoprotein [Blastomonas fulva]|uniref:MlaA family lipoprotein n=1 Tax=Blastomonas fulva TaxID=1550728 RepID=UPI0024E1D40B|nr:VacJ family lipoprotein [Blastomonas fulva]MDK2757929.1 VacJ family lipoprotein [Blastomonas fulva]